MWFHHCNDKACCPGDRTGGDVAAKKRGRLTIDLHCHALVPAVEALVAGTPQKAAEPQAMLRSMGESSVAHNNASMLPIAGPRLVRIEQRLSDMDAMGVDQAFLYPTWFAEGFHLVSDPDTAAALARAAAGKLLTGAAG